MALDDELLNRVTWKIPNALALVGSAAGGLTCYLDGGYLTYEYNLFILMRTKIQSAEKVPSGRATLVVTTTHTNTSPAGPLDITVTLDGQPIASGQIPVSVPLLFTANDCLDIGTCLGSPVSLDYYDKAPFPFDGTIDTVSVRYLT